ncbi:NAD(P)-dependent dehydrogenase (short-subunit alcohol dehydrogenase family) [Bacillus sp. V2I10]|nr:NAD(P)-dependent dehydrogenase (short-subunit alcohol dehydrogenase family) [Bacillus sp. V2I10]
MKLLTQNLCTTYAKDGSINAVCPGYIDTPLLASVDLQTKEYLVSLHPQGRLGKQKK